MDGSGPNISLELPLFVTAESWAGFQAAGYQAFEVLPKDETGSEVGNRIPNTTSQKRLAEIQEEYGHHNVRVGSPFTQTDEEIIVGPIEELSYPTTVFGVYVRREL